MSSGTVLRLTAAEFQRLVEDEHDSPLAPGAVTAVCDPLVVGTVDVTGQHGLVRHHVWVGETTAALLLHVTGDQHQLMALPPSLVPSGLARVLRIGPRKVGDREPRSADPAQLGGLFATDEVLRRSALGALSCRLAWQVALSWEAPGQDRWLAGLDGREGLWLVTGDERAPRLTPVTATDVWRRLSTLP